MPEGKNYSDSALQKSKTCSWCNKHNPRESEGHTWNKFYRFQMLNKEKKEKEKGKDEEANITTEVKVRNKSFYFDVAGTLHMTHYSGRLLNYTKCSGFVKSSVQESMQIVGKRKVVRECVLKDGLVSSFRVCKVLHNHQLGHPLMSWRKSRTKGYSECGEED